MGGGIAGLGIALALRGSSTQVVIVERDPAPPEIDPEQAFEQWKRPGVFQFRHPHVFLGRLHRLLRERHPDLLAELKHAGFWELPVSEYGLFREHYELEAGDEDLTQLCGRRATFEYVLQRLVRRLPNVRVMHAATVTGISVAREGSKARVQSIDVKHDGRQLTLTADMFVDCMGRRSPMFGWLRGHGFDSREQAQDANTLSFSRHYRLRDGATPQLDEQSGDMDFLRFAIVYEEDGRFAIGFSIAEDDVELAGRIKRADGFDRVCHAIPQIRQWVAEAEPLTPVMGVGNIQNRWVHWAERGTPSVLGLLHAGDTARETNPFYGRGCSAAFLEAHLVADALRATRSPEKRARMFAASVRRELRPYYEIALKTDRMFQARSMAARGAPLSAGQRMTANAYLRFVVPAVFEDHAVARSLLGVQHMRRPYGLLTVLALFARLSYLAARRVARGVSPVRTSMPPPRSEIMALPQE
jgi:2-polyprenyl-6-methoxyphenol hydroxylase-like FAD-dependent oxidoreductase